MVVNDNNSVRVALRIRPQSARERAEHTGICTSVVPGVPQITIGDKKSFTYDYVFDQATPQQPIYDACIRELVEGTFDGYNATVLAYGQTGSGKTYTMGTSFDPNNGHNTGIIPRAAAHIFQRIESLKATARENVMIEPQFEVLVQFIELYNEEIIDLLTEDRRSTVIKIHEDPTKGEIVLKGVTSVQINSANELLDALQNGAMNRTTAATNMNQQSSRSHAIFTVQIKQQRMVAVNSEDAQNLSMNGNTAPLTEVEMLMAKFHFVDLAGSERLKRTGATGDRAKEGISINSGLLALGNVISALGGGAGRVQHVPYRDSKLTRLLQDSLGGNSRTLMIACASPCDRDFVETLNTLNYANRAKNIKNKVVANQDKSSKLIGELRGRIATLEAELNEYRQGKKLVDENGQEVANDQYLENVSLQHEVNRLRIRLNAMDEAYNVLKQRCTTLSEQVELNKLGLTGEPASSDDSEKGSSITSAIRGYLEQIEDLQSKLDEERLTSEELRKQNNRIRAQAQAGSSYPSSPYDSTAAVIKAAKREIKKQKQIIAQQATTKGEEADESEASNSPEEEEALSTCTDEDEEESDENDVNKERDRICNDLVALQDDINVQEALIRELEKKENFIAELRRTYEKKLSDLSSRINSMEAERDKIINDMAAKANGKLSEEKVRQVKEDYERRLCNLRSEYKQLKQVEKENRRMQAEQTRNASDMRRIQNEILAMKKNKVDLMNKLKEENKRNREADIAYRKRVAAMEKAARQQQYEIQRLQRDANMKAETIKRKTEECQKLREKQRQNTSAHRTNHVRFTTDAGVNVHLSPTINEPVSQPQQVLLQQSNGLIGKKTPTISFLTPKRRNQVGHNTTFTYSPIRAKRQWLAIERAISRRVTQQQNTCNIEDELERRINERHDIQKELEKILATNSAALSAEQRAVLEEQVQSVRANLEYISSEIIRLQNELVELDNCNTAENLDTSALGSVVSAMVEECDNIMDAKYLLNNLLNTLMNQGLAIAKAEYTKKELTARIQQMERESQLISQLMIDTEPKVANKENEVVMRPKLSAEAKSYNTDKVRRRTATSEELLYATFNLNEGGKTEVLKPIPESSVTQIIERPSSVSRPTDCTFVVEPSKPTLRYDDVMKQSANSNGDDDVSLASSVPSSSAQMLPPAVAADKAKQHRNKTEIVECDDVSHQFTGDGPFLRRAAVARGHTKVLCLHSSAQHFISGGKDRTAMVWDLEKCVKTATLGKHPNNVSFVRLLPEETHCAITGSLYIAKVWDLRTKHCVRQLYSSGICTDVEEDNVTRSNEIAPNEYTIYSCTVDEDCKFLFTTYGSRVRVWSLADFTTVTTLLSDQENDVSTLTVCDVSTHSHIIRLACGSREGRVGIYDFNPYTRTGFSRDILQPSHQNIVSATVAYDNKLFTASRGGDIMCFNSQDFKRNHMECAAHERPIGGMCIFRNAQYGILPHLISGCRGGVLKVWDIHSSSRMHLTEKIDIGKGMRDVCCNSDLVFTASDDDSVYIWKHFSSM